MSSILITGGAGYIGSHMIWSLYEAGHHVVVIDNLSSGNRKSIPQDVPFFEGTIRDKGLLSHIFTQYDIDIIFHFAAYINIGESVLHPSRYYQNNVCATIDLLDSMCEHNIHNIIFSSSAAVYGEPLYTPVDIHHPTLPVNAYGRTKLMIEEVLKDYAQAYPLRSISFRYFNASGADPLARTGELHNQESHLIPTILQVASGKRSHIEIYGQDYPTPDGTCIRDFIHVFDICRAHLLAMRWLREGGEPRVYNLGNGTGVSVQTVIETSRHITNAPIPTVLRPRRLGDPAILIANAHRFQNDFGWTPKFGSLHQILNHAWTWEQQHTKGQTS